MTAERSIDPLLPAIGDAVGRAGCVVLRAAPGAGKTTRVPGALLDAGLAGDKHVVVLEPRRIAARAAAEFVARERGGAVGGEIGYRVRFESRGGPRTRLWFLTEGVFSRDLARDPFLEDVGVVVLDEFHERHLQGDLALAVVRELRATVRPDLRLVVMSATLATDALAQHLGDAPVVVAEGRTWPVTTTWSPPPPGRRLHDHVATALGTLVGAADDDGGDVLVFLPGAAEIRRTAEAIAPLCRARGIDVVPLHGDQPLDEQQRALRRGPRRRVVLATNVAETALTVEGVTSVVDGGLARSARFDARHGLDRLVLAPISQASATQRAGRAGRTAPGRCVRLWSEAEHAGRRAHDPPEIRRLDLTRPLLELRAWGLRDARTLGWLDPPPEASLAHAERLLVTLGAVDARGEMTDVGRRLLALPASPRLARMQLAAADAGCPRSGALLAALAGERDIVAASRTFGSGTADFPPGPSDLLLRLELFEDAARRGLGTDACRALGLDPRAVHAVERARRQLARHAPPDRDDDPQRLLRCVLAGFPDRVARRRAPGSDRAVLTGGTGAVLDAASVVREAELFVAVDVEGGRGADARIRMASAVERTWLEDAFPGAVTSGEELAFDPGRGAVVARHVTRYLDLVLAERVRTDVDPLVGGTLLGDAVAGDPARLAALAAPHASLLARLRFLAAAMPELDLPAEPTTLFAEAVRAAAAGRTRLASLAAADLGGMLLGLLSHRQRQALAQEAPSHWRLPTDRLAPIGYEPDRPPHVAARLQECFGLVATPRLGGGRVPLVFELLSPAHRPVQVTDDLASFWRTGYFDVRRELRGRYPRHAWPDDPLAAPPTARAKRRGS